MISEAAGRTITQAEMNDGAVVDTEMVNLARQLRQRYRTGLLSNAPSDFVRKILDDNQLNDIFDHIFISSETGYLKPRQEAFEHVLQTMEADRAKILFIDDNRQNIDAASALGIQSVTFKNVEQLKNDLRSIL